MRQRLAALGLLLLAGPAAAQTVLEARYGFGTDYRFVDASHSFGRGLVLDALYAGAPRIDELYVGVGHQWKPAEGVVLTPMLYGVAGRQNGEAGVALGAFFTLDRGGFRSLAFVGHFFRLGGSVSDYSFADAFDVTRVVGRAELGVSSGFLRSDGDWSGLVGPTVKWNDARGSWAASLRFGDDTEFRVLRIVVL